MAGFEYFLFQGVPSSETASPPLPCSIRISYGINERATVLDVFNVGEQKLDVLPKNNILASIWLKGIFSISCLPLKRNN